MLIVSLAMAAPPPTPDWQLPNGGESPQDRVRPWVGVELQVVNDEVVLIQIYPGFPGAGAGLRLGDVALAVDGTPVRTNTAFADTVAAKHVGDPTVLRIRRGGREFDVTVRLGPRPNAYELNRLQLLDKPAPAWTPDFWVGHDPTEPTAGKVVVLEFFATWCRPCVKTTGPALARWQKKYGDRGLRVFGITAENWDVAVVPFLAAHKMAYPVGSDRSRAVSNRYHQRLLPTLVVIDPDGIVRAVETSATLDRVEAAFLPMLTP